MRAPAFIFGILALAAMSCNNNSSSTANDGDKKDTMSATKMAPMSDAQPAIPAGAKVFFVNLKDGQDVTSPFKVEMGVTGMAVDSAGHLKAGSGHHHLLIDAGDSLSHGTMVPKDATHLHFGNAQTETELTLSPGKHKLTLQFADGMHRSYGGPLSATITVNVK